MPGQRHYQLDLRVVGRVVKPAAGQDRHRPERVVPPRCAERDQRNSLRRLDQGARDDSGLGQLSGLALSAPDRDHSAGAGQAASAAH